MSRIETRGSLVRRVRRIFALPVREDVDRELTFHLAMRAQELRDEGWSPAEARREAERLFGDSARIAADCRRITHSHRRTRRRLDMLDALRQDLRFGLRSLWRAPSFTAVALATLALGIGATTAIFSVVNGVLLESLPYREPDRLLALWELSESGREMRVPHRNAVDWRERARSFEDMALYAGSAGQTTVEVGERAHRSVALLVSGNFFEVLGTTPVLGRNFLPEEARLGGDPAVVVSHGFWRRELGAPRRLDDSTVRFSGRTFRVVGVLAPEVRFPEGVDLYYPRELSVPTPSRTAHNWRVLGRLAPDASVERAREELDGVAREMKQAFGDEIDSVGAAVRPLRDDLVGEVRRPLLLLLAASAMVLLVAACNLASALLARAVSRQREMAIRSAIGAGRGRVARQLLTESVLLGSLGGALGLGVAWAVLQGLLALRPTGLPRLDEVALDARVLAFAVVVSVGTGLVFGLFPILRLLRTDLRLHLSEGSRHGGPGRGRAWNLLIGLEVSLALVLLVGSGLLLRSFHGLTRVDPGFEPDGVATFRVSVPDLDFPAEFDPETYLPIEERMAAWYALLLRELEGIPGTRAVGLINQLPFGGSDANGATLLEGWDEKDYRSSSYRVVGGDYFDALDIPILRGRVFGPQDVGGPHVVVVNEEFERAFFGENSALGERVLSFGMDIHWTEWMTVVGIVGDVRHRGPREEARPEIYVPVEQRAYRASSATVVAEASGAAVSGAALGQALRQRMAERFPGLPVEVRPMDSYASRQLDRDRFSLLLLGAFAALGLALAAVGIYGVVAYSVASRTRELGIRLALGARPSAIVAQVLRGVGWVVAAGMAVGLVGAWALGRALAGQLYGVQATDPTAFIAMAAVLAGVALLASWIPARRTTAIDPTEAMRAE
ncbi:MAG: ABC transporter permease [Holophagales bacterium]|nr:ABC transporter permease [Holophagales bacterium]